MIDTSKLTKDYKNQPLKLIGRKIEYPDKNDLYELYIIQNNQKKDICEYFGISDTLLKKILREYDIRKPKIDIPKDKLKELYIDKNWSRTDVANYFGVKESTITIYCRKYNIEYKTQEQKYQNCTKTVKEKYGVENQFQRKEVKEKAKETCLNKYGTEYYQSTDEYEQKVKLTKKLRYGYENYNNYKKMRETCLKKYNIYVPSMKIGKREYYDLLDSKEKIIKFINDNNIVNIRHLAKVMNMKESYVQHKINEHELKYMFDYHKSYMEKEIQDYIANYYPDSVNNYDIERNKELDVYIPSLNIGIEFDGNYWHSEEVKGKNAQLDKTLLCEKYGIFVYHIFEYEWVNYKEKILNQLNNLLGLNKNKIGARKCEIQQVNTKEKNKFLESNHLQGGDRCNIAYGLYYDNNLVSIMTFSKPRFNKKYDWELSRFANKAGFNISGSASKLFNHFIKENKPSNILSYSDMAKTKGLIYKTLGFNLDHISKPNYVWIKKNEYLTRYQCQKHLLIKKGFKGNTEKEIMENAGYYRLFDCGNKVWVWQK